jgi:ABC-2 type transport system ATP-binding protein
LVHQPDLLVLDEPMNGLDPKGMREFREMILSLREKGVSVLVSSHQLSDIEQIADHLIVVQKGKVTHQVAMAELKAEKNVLIIKTDDNAETEALLKASFEVEVLQVADELQVTLATDQRSAIAAAIVTAGIGLKELRTKQSSLEDTFLAWTEEGGL